eukprot:CAMPEP_0177353780 /NCGR_PEP_ID=MMETSP0368-20130122/33070_1 /TAXON_ID=447022 ORGANISM="Scrippsiella hangoei-like, Strain SHHI-4" /NCGR_SAMPLE_ID=MMETSP0368 /ASSEMBLY_ACC=CAM_ASM_000363 /LENGTH=470 /DNA_ID=CAMNT_0018815859 /DNA_START=336 /DNA_END=1745 /DNA_ORIENTATION=+
MAATVTPPRRPQNQEGRPLCVFSACIASWTFASGWKSFATVVEVVVLATESSSLGTAPSSVLGPPMVVTVLVLLVLLLLLGTVLAVEVLVRVVGAIATKGCSKADTEEIVMPLRGSRKRGSRLSRKFSRKDLEANLICNSLAVQLGVCTMKASNSPAEIVTLALMPYKSTTALWGTPHSEASFLAKTTLNASSPSMPTAIQSTPPTWAWMCKSLAPQSVHASQSKACEAPAKRVQVLAGQLLHEVAVKALLQVPGGQALQKAAPPELNFPGVHLIHTPSLAWPSAGWKVPAGQSLHVPTSSAPCTSLHVPALHEVQLEWCEAPSMPLQLPLEQSMQVDGEEAPATLLQVPGVHGEQTASLVAPKAVDHVPAGHFVQLDIQPNPSRLPQVPSGQPWHDRIVGEPSWELQVPIGQGVQSSSEDALCTSLHVPGVHLRHSSIPSALHVPAPHAVHSLLCLVGCPVPAQQGPVA